MSGSRIRRVSMRARAAWLLVGLIGLMCASGPAAAIKPILVFHDPSIQQISVSPTGTWVVGVLRHGEAHGISAQRPGDGVTYPIFASRDRIVGLTWVGPDSVYVSWASDRWSRRFGGVIRLRTEGGVIFGDELRLGSRGELVSGLPDEDEVVLWAEWERDRSNVYRTTVDRLTLTASLGRSNSRDAEEVERVASVRKPVARWVTDMQGRVRAYVSRTWDEGPQIVVGHRSDASDGWDEVWRSDDLDQEEIVPVGFTAGGSRLIVTAYAGRNTRGLHELDPATGAFGDVLFARPDVDVTGALFDHARSGVIAAEYVLGGQVRYAYLEGYAERHLAGVKAHVDGDGVAVTSSSLDHRYFILLETGPRNPGTFYFFAKESGFWAKVGERLVGVSADDLVDCRSIFAHATDGTRVEGFLTLPHSRTGSRPPLVVLPHGGPIGVADGATFDPLPQYLALLGFAVLQVNYRGSGGYGKEFMEAGLGQWGQAIEDDIDAVVQAVVDEGSIDPDRMCIVGGSYGGYSALMSAIRRPERYRCVATLNGVTDIPLMFQGSEWSHTEYWVERMRSLVGGDPESDYDALAALSPVYHVGELAAPVLIAHGTRDRRVDVEHAHRLRAMLEAHGKPYDWLLVGGGEHSPTATEWVRYAIRLAGFLQQHIGPTERHTPRR